MMKLEADIVPMTMPDIETFHIKRSYIKKDIEYIYLFHGFASTYGAAGGGPGPLRTPFSAPVPSR